MLRELLSFIPSNIWTISRKPCSDPIDRNRCRARHHSPAQSNLPYDIKDVIRSVRR